MNRDTQKRLFNLCDPREPLGLDDRRNVDVDAFGGSARGCRWADVLARPMELSDRPSFTLLASQRGAGLTTELRRLGAHLSDTAGANLLVVLIDGEHVLDLHSPIDVPEVLLAVVEQTDAALCFAEGKGMTGGVPARLRRWLKEASVEPIAASAALRSNAAARARFRRSAGAELSRFVAEVRSELTLLEGRARRLGRNGIAVLFDSIARLRGDSATWREVLASAERVFDAGASSLELPVHVVYTVPAPLALRLSSPVSFLPQIALFNREGRASEPGFAVAREIVWYRVPDDALDALFGAEAREASVKRLLSWSGGNPAAIVRLLRDCVVERSIDALRFRQILALDADGLRRTTPEGANPCLARVHVEKALPLAEDPSPRALIADRLVLDGAVLRYQGDESWYDVHPGLLEMPRLAAEIGRLRRTA